MNDRLLAGHTADHALGLESHLAIHGPLPSRGRELIDEIERAGLRGRGGSGFPTATKLAAVAPESRPVLVVNGTEGEPMSAKDDILMRHVPHLVLDGAEAAARAIGAHEIIVCAGPDANAALSTALLQRQQGPRRGRLRHQLVARAGGYVAGEETAVLAHLEGRAPKPRVTPPRPTERGLRGRPTLVQNVETLAHLALIARHGAEWFRAVGTDDRPGTSLVTVTAPDGSLTVDEVAGGTPLSQIVMGAGTKPADVRAVLVGGYFGAWLGSDKLGVALDDRALRPHGAAVGAGVIVALPNGACPMAETARIARYLADQSAGQCGPCAHGLPALAGVVERFAAGQTEAGDGQRLVRWTEMVRRRGACAHPDGAARMLASAVREFRLEFEQHAISGPCQGCHAPSRLVLPVTRTRVAA